MLAARPLAARLARSVATLERPAGRAPCARGSPAPRARRSLAACARGISPAPCARGSPAPRARRSLAARAGPPAGSERSWSEIAAEGAEVVKAALTKIKDSILKPAARPPQAPLRRRDEPPQQQGLAGLPGGLLGGLVGGLVGSAVKGLARELERSAADGRSVADTAARRIGASARLQRRLGAVRAGPPLSQAVSSSSINGRVQKRVQLVLPVVNAAGAMVAQAQVTAVEGDAMQHECRIAVRMPEGDTLLLDDDDDGGDAAGSGAPRAGRQGEVIVDAEFKDLS
ncbi:hypothetical protein HT031_004955 [Scenedesmus sp. PABB004]|nr:hypothetical protein HT031_004955 [Scenedesmus sp. PABB004]